MNFLDIWEELSLRFGWNFLEIFVDCFEISKYFKTFLIFLYYILSTERFSPVFRGLLLLSVYFSDENGVPRILISVDTQPRSKINFTTRAIVNFMSKIKMKMFSFLLLPWL